MIPKRHKGNLRMQPLSLGNQSTKRKAKVSWFKLWRTARNWCLCLSFDKISDKIPSGQLSS